MHAASRRSNGRYVAVNMAAIPATTAPAELFGHTRGAFSGATNAHGGYFGRADGGTLFLDEIGETPDEVQPVLLRVLESGEVQPLGGREPRPVDVRVIAATDAELETAVDEGRFRQSLLHRLAGYVLHVPPLRARREDIGPLLIHFLRQELGTDVAKLDAAGEGPAWLPASLVARLLRYPWPGNVRQLRNVARQLVIAGEGRQSVSLDPTVERLLPTTERATLPSPAAPLPPPTKQRRRLVDITDDDVLQALRDNHWRIGASARALGISKTSLYQLMDRNALIRKAKDLSSDEITQGLRDAHGDLTLLARTLEVSRRGLQLRMTELGIKADN